MINLTRVKLNKGFQVQERTNVFSLQEIWTLDVRLLVAEKRERVTDSENCGVDKF